MAPSGLLFEVLFVTLGRYWGPLGPKLQKDARIEEKWEPEGNPFWVIFQCTDIKSDVVFCSFCCTSLDGFWVTLGKPNVVKV